MSSQNKTYFFRFYLLLAGFILFGGTTVVSQISRDEHRQGYIKTTQRSKRLKKVKSVVVDSIKQHIPILPKYQRDTTSHWEIILENSFIQDPDSTYFGEGLFSDYSIQRDVNVMKIPIHVEGHLIIQNSTINKRFSGINVGFDSERFIRSYQEKLVNRDIKEVSENMFSKKKSQVLEKANKEKYSLFLHEKLEKSKAEAMRKIHLDTAIYSKQIQVLNQEKEKKMEQLHQYEIGYEDSLRNRTEYHTDSLSDVHKVDSLRLQIAQIKAKTDSIMLKIMSLSKQAKSAGDWIEQEQKKIKNLQSEKDAFSYAEQLPRTIKQAPLGLDTLLKRDITLDTAFQSKINNWKSRSNWHDQLTKEQDRVKEYSQWEDKQKEQWDQLSDPEALKKYAATKSFYISPLHKFLLGLKKLEVGAIRLSDSPQIIGTVPANGFATEWSSGKYVFSAVIGKEGQTQNAQLTDFIRNSNRFGLNRKVVQTKAGIGNKEKNFYGASFTQFTADIPIALQANPIPQRNKNILIGIEGKQFLTKTFFLSANSVLSSTDVTGASTTQGLVNADGNDPMDRTAFDANFGCEMDQTQSILEIGYSHIGGAYQTLGNPFLITNRNDIRAKIQQKLLHKRLILTGEARISTSIKNNITPLANKNLYNADASWRINRKGSRIWVKYQPIAFVQKIGETQSTLQFNTAQIGYQTSGKISKTLQWNAIIQGMNFRQEANASDTAFTIGRKYGTLFYSIRSSQWMFSLNSYGGFDGTTLSEGQIGQNSTWMSKKMQIEGGLQIIRRPFDSTLRKGFSAGFALKIKKWGELGINGMWLKRIESENKNGFYGNSFFRIII